MKRLVPVLLALMLLCGLMVAGCGDDETTTTTAATPQETTATTAAPSGETYYLRWAQFATAVLADSQPVIKMAENIKTRTNGRCTVELFWSDSLVPMFESMDAVRLGSAEMATFPFGPFGGMDPRFTSSEMPLYYNTIEAQVEAQFALGDAAGHPPRLAAKGELNLTRAPGSTLGLLGPQVRLAVAAAQVGGTWQLASAGIAGAKLEVLARGCAPVEAGPEAPPLAPPSDCTAGPPHALRWSLALPDLTVLASDWSGRLQAEGAFAGWPPPRYNCSRKHPLHRVMKVRVAIAGPGAGEGDGLQVPHAQAPQQRLSAGRRRARLSLA